MVGVLASQEIHASSQCVNQSLAQVNSVFYERRTRTKCQNSPILYSSNILWKHIDQNEKLVLFGVTHVCATDEYSGMMVVQPFQ